MHTRLTGCQGRSTITRYKLISTMDTTLFLAHLWGPVMVAMGVGMTGGSRTGAGFSGGVGSMMSGGGASGEGGRGGAGGGGSPGLGGAGISRRIARPGIRVMEDIPMAFMKARQLAPSRSR